MSYFSFSDSKVNEIKIRDIDADSCEEIQLVAQRMRETLIEVLGEEKGTSLYSMQWLEDRVRWHLDVKNTKGRVLVAQNKTQEIVAHAIARIDKGAGFGYFSTVFVAPHFRKMGVASVLMDYVEDWFRQNKMNKVIYNTAENHAVLLKIFKSRGYEVTHAEAEMLQLTKFL